MLTRDVTAVVDVDVTGVAAETGIAETHGTGVVQDTARRVYSTGQVVLRTRYRLCQHSYSSITFTFTSQLGQFIGIMHSKPVWSALYRYKGRLTDGGSGRQQFTLPG